MHATLPLLEQSDFPFIKRGPLETLQVNMGYKCNQQCLHCHVNAGPNRKEVMDENTVEQVISFLDISKVKILDITGGAPELNPLFRFLVKAAQAMDVHVIDRCNLTILEESGQEDLAQFLAEHHIEVIASLPCYLEENVDKQRGKGVFNRSIHGLRKLNQLGYGKEGTGLILNLVYNPIGPYLPPPQHVLEDAYKKHLDDKYGVFFNNLFTITNMPIQRFGSTLISNGQFDEYMHLLRNAFNSANLDGLMCRSLISIDWQGYVYDCDFNQMLGLPLGAVNKPRVHLKDLMQLDLNGKPITVKDHCYGCTAGQGSSCGGALG
jgi:radical SAM/Cys-rich protein